MSAANFYSGGNYYYRPTADNNTYNCRARFLTRLPGGNLQVLYICVYYSAHTFSVNVSIFKRQATSYKIVFISD